MAENVQLPKWGLSMTEGTLSKWYKKVGDRVEKDEPIAVVDSDKVSGDVLSPSSGIVAKLLLAEGDSTQVGTDVAIIATDEQEFRQITGPPR